MISNSRHKIDKLDIVIARACNLNCEGCVTFSNFSHIRGILRWQDQKDKILPWLDRLEISDFITLFGGEPLLNPDIMDYLQGITSYYEEIGESTTISIQTNGIRLLENLDIIRFGCNKKSIVIDVSLHSSNSKYQDKVKLGIKRAQDIITEHMQTDPNLKNFLTVTDYVGEYWMNHYLTKEDGSIEPARDYNSTDAPWPHKTCHIKDFVNLYDGRLYKCPPMATIANYGKQTSNFNYKKWRPWLEEYKSCGIHDDLGSWLETRKGPENVCNMCFPPTRDWQNISHDAKLKYNIAFDEAKFNRYF